MSVGKRLRVMLFMSALLLMSCTRLSLGQSTTSTSERPFIARPTGTTYKVLLSVDGGAFRGIITVSVLIEFEEAIKRYILLQRPELLPKGFQIDTIDDFEVSLADYTDCISGSSSGSWFALYLASKGGNGVSANIFKEKRFIERYGMIAPGSARGLLVMLNEFINGVFPQDQVSAFLSNANLDPTDPGLLTPVITENESQSVFNGFLGRVTLSELSTSCMITGYDLISRSGILFVHDKFTTPSKTGFTRLIRRSTPRTRNSTFMSDIQGNYGVDYFISDVAIASSTASTFIASYEIFPAKGEAERMVIADGAVYRVDPSLLASVQIVNSTRASSYSDIAILSITGGTELQNLSSSANGGSAQWDAPPFQRVLYSLYTVTQISNKQLELFFYADPAVKAGQYLRVDLYGQPGTELQRILSGGFLSTDLPVFTTIANQVVDAYRASIESFVENFVFG